MSTVARAEFKRAKVDRIWSRVAVRRINLRKLANVSFLLPATAVSVYRVRSNNAPEFRVIHHGKLIAWSTRVSKRFVYVLTNDESPPKYYTGLTSDVLRR